MAKELTFEEAAKSGEVGIGSIPGNGNNENNSNGNNGGVALAEIDLSQYDESFDAAVATTNEQAPDGTHVCVIMKFSLETAMTSGEPKISWGFKVVGGPNHGKPIWKSSVIKADTIRFLKGDIAKCGIVLNKFSELQDEKKRAAFIGIGVEVKKMTPKDSQYSNVYINKRVEINPELLAAIMGSEKQKSEIDLSGEIPF
jgi:hypothetical protein